MLEVRYPSEVTQIVTSIGRPVSGIMLALLIAGTSARAQPAMDGRAQALYEQIDRILEKRQLRPPSDFRGRGSCLP